MGRYGAMMLEIIKIPPKPRKLVPLGRVCTLGIQQQYSGSCRKLSLCFLASVQQEPPLDISLRP